MGGNVFVADENNNRVQKFTGDGVFLTKWGSVGTMDAEFIGPFGVAVGGSGNVFVADGGNNRVQKFNGDGVWLATFGNAPFSFPTGVAVDASGDVFIVDRPLDRVREFTGAGVVGAGREGGFPTFVTEWGGTGTSGNGEFNHPSGIAVDRNGNVFVADTDNNRIQKFSCARIVDNGDGTVTDRLTGLQWEKKDSNPASVHDVNDRYRWSGLCADAFTACQPSPAAAALCESRADGGEGGAKSCVECGSPECNGNTNFSTVWDFASQLNATTFAGHDDWRLPSEDGLNQTPNNGRREEETILLDVINLCTARPCIAPVFGPTLPDNYWSGSAADRITLNAFNLTNGSWFIPFGDPPGILIANAATELPVRAMRQIDLVAHYPFNGNANDTSGFGRHLTVLGPTLAPDRHGQPDSAYHFDGVDDFIVATAEGLPAGPRTVALWFRADTVDTRPVVLGYGGGDCGTSWLMALNLAGDGAYALTTHCDAFTLEHLWTTAPVGVWTHFAVSTTGNATRMYVDGNEVASSDTFFFNTGTAGTKLGIGVASGPTGDVPFIDSNVGYFRGDIDDVRIYNRFLSADEIRALASP